MINLNQTKSEVIQARGKNISKHRQNCSFRFILRFFFLFFLCVCEKQKEKLKHSQHINAFIYIPQITLV